MESKISSKADIHSRPGSLLKLGSTTDLKKTASQVSDRLRSPSRPGLAFQFLAGKSASKSGHVRPSSTPSSAVIGAMRPERHHGKGSSSSEASRLVRLSMKLTSLKVNLTAASKKRKFGEGALVKMAAKAKERRSRFTVVLSKFKVDALRRTAKLLMLPGLGILGADESERQLGEILHSLQLQNTETNRQRYFELLFGDAVGDTDLHQCLSGVLIRPENYLLLPSRKNKLTGWLKDRKLLMGARLDTKVQRIAGTDREYTTSDGLDRLEEKLTKLKFKGVTFGLWRCVYRISEYTPSNLALTENSRTLAKFASLLQQMCLVPIVSAEVLAEGDHDYDTAQNVLKDILTHLVTALAEFHVMLDGLLVRITPATPGPCYRGAMDNNRAALNTATVLNQCLPPAVAGVLLARDETLDKSTAILNQLQLCPVRKPFFVTFCYSLVMVEGVVSTWAGEDKNKRKARLQLLKRVKLCSQAAMGGCNIGWQGCFFVSHIYDY